MRKLHVPPILKGKEHTDHNSNYAISWRPYVPFSPAGYFITFRPQFLAVLLCSVQWNAIWTHYTSWRLMLYYFYFFSKTRSSFSRWALSRRANVFGRNLCVQLNRGSNGSAAQRLIIRRHAQSATAVVASPTIGGDARTRCAVSEASQSTSWSGAQTPIFGHAICCGC